MLKTVIKDLIQDAKYWLLAMLLNTAKIIDGLVFLVTLGFIQPGLELKIICSDWFDNFFGV